MDCILNLARVRRAIFLFDNHFPTHRQFERCRRSRRI